MAQQMADGEELYEEDLDDEDEDEDMLCDGHDEMEDELKGIDEKVEDIEVDINDLDKASYSVPETDEGFRRILEERFGHTEFLEG